MPKEPEEKEQGQIDPELVKALLAKVDSLEKKDLENQEKLKMLYEVADKGRVFNYENQRADRKTMKVKLSVFQNKYIVGWRTIKDELVKHPTTGAVVGEVQEYEVLLLDADGKIEKATLNGYPAFSEARYAERVEVEVVSKKEDFSGKLTFDIKLPTGTIYPLDARFVN